MLLPSRNGSDRRDRTVSDEARLDGGDKATRGIAPAASASHDDAVVGFGTALDEGSKEVVDEMRMYEEVSPPSTAGSGSHR